MLPAWAAKMDEPARGLAGIYQMIPEVFRAERFARDPALGEAAELAALARALRAAPSCCSSNGAVRGRGAGLAAPGEVVALLRNEGVVHFAAQAGSITFSSMESCGMMRRSSACSRRHAGARMRGNAAQHPAVELDGAGRGPQRPHDGAHERGLPRAVAADEAGELAALAPRAHVAQDAHRLDGHTPAPRSSARGLRDGGHRLAGHQPAHLGIARAPPRGNPSAMMRPS